MLYEPHEASLVQSRLSHKHVHQNSVLLITQFVLFFILLFLSLLFIFGLFIDLLFMLNPGTHILWRLSFCKVRF